MRMTRRMAERYRQTMVEISKNLSDAEAAGVPMLFKRWNGDGMELEEDDRVYHKGVLYKVKQGHITQPTWEPDKAVSLFSEVLIPIPTIIYDWKQPDSTNGYKIGDKVRHNGKIWESRHPNNIWEPGALGTEALWVEVEE